jgi:hypothetical protein
VARATNLRNSSMVLVGSSCMSSNRRASSTSSAYFSATSPLHWLAACVRSNVSHQTILRLT